MSTVLDPERLFREVARGENVIVAANRLGYPLSEVLECLYEREGDYRGALKKVPRVTKLGWWRVPE